MLIYVYCFTFLKVLLKCWSSAVNTLLASSSILLVVLIMGKETTIFLWVMDKYLEHNVIKIDFCFHLFITYRTNSLPKSQLVIAIV